MARHPPVPRGRPAELHLRDPQGDFRQDGMCHGTHLNPNSSALVKCMHISDPMLHRSELYVRPMQSLLTLQGPASFVTLGLHWFTTRHSFCINRCLFSR